MSEWKAKRFWTDACVVDCAPGFGIELDGRPVRTPGKSLLVVPTRALAQAITAEWDAQTGKVDPETMPLTRTANSAMEKVAPQKSEVAILLAAYGDTDLTCYRAEAPEELVRRQIEAWDPLLDWAAETYHARLIPVQGVIHRAQTETALCNLTKPLMEMSEFELAGFHDLVSLTGSLIIALATIQGLHSAETLWSTSRIDEDWQAQQWGADDEAQAMAEGKRRAFLDGLSFYRLSAENS